MTPAERATRWALVLIGLAPLAPTLIGSAVNIWYNLVEIDPLLTEAQRRCSANSCWSPPRRGRRFGATPRSKRSRRSR